MTRIQCMKFIEENAVRVGWSDSAQSAYLHAKGYSDWDSASDETVQAAVNLVESAASMFRVELRDMPTLSVVTHDPLLDPDAERAEPEIQPTPLRIYHETEDPASQAGES